MTDTREQQIWAALLEAGAVKGDMPEHKIPDSPWYVKVLLGFSGWLAAIFILGFIGVGFDFIFKDKSLAALVGIAMIGGAFILLRISKNEFVEHLGLAASLAGQALLVYAMFEFAGHKDILAVWILLTLLQIILVVLMPNYVHRVFSSFIAAIAFSMAFTEIKMPYWGSGIVMFIAAICWLKEFKYPVHMEKIRAAGYGFTMALILLKGVALFGSRIFGYHLSEKESEFWTYPWFGEIIIGVVTIYVVWSLLKRYGCILQERTTLVFLIAAILLCVVSLKVQGITVGIVIMILGFSASNRVLLGLGIVSLLFYISTYYYLLDITLLHKSLILLVAGLVLLTLRWFMLRLIPIHEEVHHAE